MFSDPLPLTIAASCISLTAILGILNISHDRRHAQLWSPLLAVGIAAIGLGTVLGFDTLAVPVTSAITNNIPQQWQGIDLSVLRGNSLVILNLLLLAAMLAGKVLFRLLGAASWLLLRITSFITAGLAAGIVISFLARIQRFLWSKGIMPGYFWHAETERVRLKNSAVFVGRLLRWVGWSCASLAAFHLYARLKGGTITIIAGSFLGAPQLTIAAMIVLLESGWYLDGQLIDNASEDFVGENPASFSKGSCRELLKTFSERWQDILLAANSQLPARFYDNPLPTSREELEDHDLLGTRLITRNLYHLGIYLDEYQQLFLQSILKKESVIVYETRVDVFAPAVFAHVQKIIFARSHVLFLHHGSPKGEIENAFHRFIKSWLEKPLFATVQEASIATTEDFNGTERIMLAAVAPLLRTYPWSPKWQSWMDKIDLIVILDLPTVIYPNAFTARLALCLLESHTTFQVIVRTPHDRTNTESALHSLFRTNKFREFRFHSPYPPDACYAVWKSDRRADFQNILATETNKNFSTPLSLPYALAYGALQGNIPLVQLQECLDDQHFQEELSRQRDAGGSPAKKFNNQPLPFDERKPERSFTITEDYYHNLVIALNKSLTTATFGVFANVAVSSYMLREYHADNIIFFLTGGIEMPPLLAPELDYSRLSAATELLFKTKKNTSIAITEVCNILSRTRKKTNGDIELVAGELTTVLLKTVLGSGNESFTVQSGIDRDNNPCLSISCYPIPDIIKELTAYYQVTGKNGETIATIPAHIMPQPYEHQIIHLNEKPYCITDVNYNSRTLTVSYIDDYQPATDRLQRKINNIDGPFTSDKIISVNVNQVELKINLFEASYTISTYGMLRFPDQGNRIDAVEEYNFDSSVPEITISHGQLLSLSISAAEITSSNKTKMAASLAFLFQGLIVSVFPETSHELLVTSPDLCEPKGIANDDILSFLCTCPKAIPAEIRQEGNNYIQILLVEASPYDLGMCQALARNWNYIFEILADYLSWHHAEKTDKHDDYLAFGRGEPPSWLMLDEMREIFCHLDENRPDSLRHRRQNYLASLAENEGILQREQRFCDFCGIPLSSTSYNVLADGREQCEQCKKTAVTDIARLQQLFYESRRWLAGTYKITLRKSITIHFTSAKEIMNTQGRIFRPTPDFDRRPVGIARRHGNDFMVYIENAQPYFKTLGIITHELTHIWQYDNLNMQKIENEYGDLLIEGHAQMTEISLLEEKGYALDHCRAEKERSDLYGQGYRLLKKYLDKHKTANPFKYLKGRYEK